MSQIRENKIQTIVNADAYNLSADLASMADTSNVVIKVSSQAERDALVKVAGKCVIRLDLPGLPIQRCDGTNWIGTQHAEFTASNTSASGAAWGMGTFTLDGTKTTDSAFVTINAVDKLQVTAAGIYAVTTTVAFTNPVSGLSWVDTGDFVRVSIVAGNSIGGAGHPNQNLAAAALIQPQCMQTTGSNQAFTSRVRVTRIA